MFLKKVTWCGKHLCGVEMQGTGVSYWEGHLKEVTQAPLARKELESAAQRWGWEGKYGSCLLLGHVLFLDLSGYMAVFILWNFAELYVLDLGSFHICDMPQ